jgi:16S rRNA processing protein RimM
VLAAGRVGRPHGLDGFFHVAECAPELLEVGTVVRVAGRASEIVDRKGTDDKPIIRLSSTPDRSAVLAIRGEILLVAREVAPPLEEDEYWADDLVGCEVVVSDERVLGKVKRLLAMPSCEVLELDSGDLVPMVRDAIKQVDLEARRIDVDGGFLGHASR